MADMVWPALYLETRIFSWWAILTGILVEYFFVLRIFALSPRQAVIADVSANAVSSFLGLLLIPLSGLLWELFPGSVYMWALNWGTFNPMTWIGAFLLASLINAWVEGLVYIKLFKVELSYSSRRFGWLVVANMISVGIAWASFLVAPARP